jgi:TFIIF-interacting CTD phosphatase-like protein
MTFCLPLDGDFTIFNSTRKYPNSYTNKCLVLDLDETLVHTEESFTSLHETKILTSPQNMALRSRLYINQLEDAVFPRGSGMSSNVWGIKRPHLEDFLDFCFKYFKIVIIWSAGRANYVNEVVKSIFTDLDNPHAVFTWDQCVKDQDDIKKPIEKLIASHPYLSNYMSLKNTIIIDDRPEYIPESNSGNNIVIPEYCPPLSVEGINAKDNALVDVMHWLATDEVAWCEDIRTIDKTKIFK